MYQFSVHGFDVHVVVKGHKIHCAPGFLHEYTINIIFLIKMINKAAWFDLFG